MADQLRAETAHLKNRLLKQGSHFSFFQVNRLLRLISIAEGRNNDSIQFRPNLTLGFPENDIDQIEENTKRERYEVTTNFLGLYGSTSPLPTFYTEDLINESMEGRECSKKFLDLINQTVYPLFYRAWTKSRPHIRIIEYGDMRFLKIFYSFLGFRDPLANLDHPAFNSLFRFAGIFTQNSKSALGLETILKGLFPDAKAEVVQFDKQLSLISEDQRFLLGKQASILGEDCHLGVSVKTRQGNLAIKLRNVGGALFGNLRPGKHEYEKLNYLVRYYLVDPLNINLHIYLKAGEAKPIQLGSPNWSALGQSTWLLPKTHNQVVNIRMKL
jgi:type VI secretion system protein ImpH